MAASLSSFEPASSGVQVAIEQRFEYEGVERTICVATALARVLEPE